MFERKRDDFFNQGFQLEDGTYHAVWERKRMPDPGAQNYAWETYGLPPFTPIGTGIPTQQPLIATSEQVYTMQAVSLVGMPTVSGQILGQPLFDPNVPGGYASGMAHMISPLASLNIVASRPDPIAPNAVDPTRVG